MDNCDVPVHLTDHDYWRRRRISARQAEGAGKPGACSKCPCCRNDQVLNLTQRSQHSAPAANLPQKRKRSSVPRPSKPSAQHPGKMDLAPRPRSAIPPADLPLLSNVPPRPKPSSADNQLSSTGVNQNGPLTIHNRSMEEYQQIYHEVVDDMLRCKSGRVRPCSLELGRCVKQKLWERLDHPMMTTSADQDGLVHVDVSYGVGVHPPLYDIDTLGEPSPGQPPNKRAKN